MRKSFTIKKLILLLVVAIFSAGVFWMSKSNTKHRNAIYSSANNSEVIMRNDQNKLESNLEQETIHNVSWRYVKDYSTPPKKFVNINNAQQLFKLANGSISNLNSCLKKDFCGMEKRSENDSYFDRNQTPGHILLARNLSIMVETLRVLPELEDEIDWDLVRELTDSSNENIQVLAIELMKNLEPDLLFKLVDNYKGNAKADALAGLSKNRSSSDRSLLINALEKSFAGDDPNTVISVVEKLKKMHLSNEEVEKISKNLCHYKEKGTDDPNWKMIKYDMRKSSVDLEIICSN